MNSMNSLNSNLLKRKKRGGGVDSTPIYLRYNFETITGTSTPDTSTTANINGTIQGTPTATIDNTTFRVGTGSIKLNGTSQYVTNSTAFPTLPPVSTTGISFTFWIKNDNTTYGRAFQLTNLARFIIASVYSNNIQFYYYSQEGEVKQSGAYSINNEWTHFAWVLKDANWDIYINGVRQTQLQNMIYPDRAVYALGIGSLPEGGGAYFKGNIDDFRIYQTALTQTNVTNIYNIT